MSPRPSCATLFVRFAALAGALLAVAGCSLGAGGIGISPGQPLTGQARRVRISVPPTAPIARELDKTVATPYFIEPGDELLVEPASFDSPLRFPTDQAVLSDGTIDLGKYGRVIAAGFTIEQIEEVVESIVRQREQGELEPADLAVNVRLIDPQSKVYYVLGEVNAPGSYNLIGRETVLDAILTAGGLTDSAASCQIILARPTAPTGCRVVLNICYKQIVQLGDTATNYQIMPGDRIFVASRPWWAGLIPGLGSATCHHCNKNQVPCGSFQCAIPFTRYLIPDGAVHQQSAEPDESLPSPSPPAPVTTP